MLDWIRKLFGSWDRQGAAADRAAVAMEEIAGMLEGARDALRARLLPVKSEKQPRRLRKE